MKKHGQLIQLLTLAMLILFVAGSVAEAYSLGSQAHLKETPYSLDHINDQLIADGIAGARTFGLSKATAATTAEEEDSRESEFNFSPSELDLFARLVHAEAAGEPFEGQVAVAASVLNRMRSPKYPSTLSRVIYQVSNGFYQYSPVLDGRINRPAGASARKAVEEAVKGSDPSRGALGFFNPSKTRNRWVHSQQAIRTIGNHIFFR